MWQNLYLNLFWLSIIKKWIKEKVENDSQNVSTVVRVLPTSRKLKERFIKKKDLSATDLCMSNEEIFSIDREKLRRL